MPDCSHSELESLCTVQVQTGVGGRPYHQVRVQVRCATCPAVLTFAGLPLATPENRPFLTVAVGPGGNEVVLSGLLAVPLATREGQLWTKVVMPEVPPASECFVPSESAEVVPPA